MEFIPSTPQPSLSHELRALINQRNILTAKSKSKVLNALDKQIDENKKRQQMDLRNKVIEEIFTSEVSYLYQLEIIMKFFKEPLESSNLIATATQRTLFGNIESIYQVNGELINQLKINGSNVAAAFLHLAPFFKMYSMYAYNYKNATSLLEDLRGNNSSVGRWIRSQESRPEVGNRLGALLIAPIQRLPRYRLLLRQLLSLTPECHPHRSTLVEAVKEVEKATSHINSQVSEQETHTRLVALQNCLLHSKPCIVGPNKKLIKEGVLMKMSANGRKAQKRYFILLSDSIVYCKLVGRGDEGPPQEPGSLQGCCLLPIGKCSVENILGQGVFNLTCHNETYILFSEHRDDATEWITAIRGAIAQYHDNLKTLRKRSSSRHTLHLTRKRKFLKENNHQSEESPMKKMKTHSPGGQEEERENQHCEERETPYICEDSSPKNNYLQSIKSLLTTFGESVRRYMFPGPSYR